MTITLECQECETLALVGEYDSKTHAVTYRCGACGDEYYDTNLDTEKEVADNV